jgi:hypothetical protein
MESSITPMYTPLFTDRDFIYDDADKDVDILLRESPTLASKRLPRGEIEHDSSPDADWVALVLQILIINIL